MNLKNKEIEFKYLIQNAAIFLKILIFFFSLKREYNVNILENYFYDSPDWILKKNRYILRYRKTEDNEKIYLKGKIRENKKIGFEERVEFEENFKNSNIKEIYYSQLPNNIKDCLVNLGIDKNLCFKNWGFYKTKRYDFIIENIVYSLDKIDFPNRTEYELEAELNCIKDYKKVKKMIEKINKQIKISLIHSFQTKSERLYNYIY